MRAVAYVPAACPIAPPRPLRTPLNPALQLTLYELAQAIGDSPLTGITAVQVDQRGPRAAMPHPIHQLAQRGPCYLTPSACYPCGADHESACLTDQLWSARDPTPGAGSCRNGAPVGLVNTSAPGGLAVNLAK